MSLILTSPIETACRTDFCSFKLIAFDDKIKTSPFYTLIYVKAKLDNYFSIVKFVIAIALAFKVPLTKTFYTLHKPKPICKVVGFLVSQLMTKLDNQIRA